ncbi:MAG: leucine-rich repeat domain-containing protein [Ruminococcaceae bacterium]|nr:leucine-rich repeat domain-containing protein [Oscillospiraceae bacterium]
MKTKFSLMIVFLIFLLSVALSSCTNLKDTHQHVNTTLQKENIVEPTCSSPGQYDLVKYCTDCNNEFERKTIKVPASAHIASNDICSICNRTASVGLEYKLNKDNTYSVIGLGTCTDNQIIIPTQHNGKQVKTIGKKAFYGCTEIYAISCQPGLSTIEEYAFENCIDLSSVYILSNVTSLDTGVFDCCAKLDNLTFTSSITHISSTFYGCESLRKVDFLGNANQWSQIDFYSSPTYFSQDLYINGNLLTDLVLDDSITKISDNAFCYLQSLKTVKLPRELKNTGNWIFYNCPNIEFNEYDNALYLGNDTNKYLMLVKAKNNSISSCKIHPETKIIGAFAFYRCYELPSIELPDGLLFIGSSSFTDCKKITNLIIPESVLYIDNYAFSNTGLKNVTFLPSHCEHAYSAFSGVAFENGGLEVKIGANVTIIPGCIFTHSGGGSQPANIKSITFEKGSNCTEIKYNAFKDCPNNFDVYYFDSKEQWDTISIEFGNEMLTSANKHFE